MRIVKVVMRAARQAERDTMVPRAIEILDKLAIEIEAEPDPALNQLMAEVRAEVEARRA